MGLLKWYYEIISQMENSPPVCTGNPSLGEVTLLKPSCSGENSQVAVRTALSLSMNSFLFFLFQLVVHFSSVKTIHLVGYVSALSIPTKSSKGTPLRYTMKRETAQTPLPPAKENLEHWTRQSMAKANFKGSGFQASLEPSVWLCPKQPNQGKRNKATTTKWTCTQEQLLGLS